MSKNENELKFSLETPVDANLAAYTTDDRNDDRKEIKRRGVSFGTSSLVTPQTQLKIEVDSPYTDVTPEMVAQLLDNDRRKPPTDHKLHGSTQGCDFDLLPLFMCGLLRLDLLANTLSKWNKGNSPIPHLLESPTEKRPMTINAIAEVTKHTGFMARSLITKARQLLQSIERDTHSSILCAL